jgi:hypothetical protein
MKQIYKITYHPTGKIYIEKDSLRSYRYYGRPDMDTVNADLLKIPNEIRKGYTIRKEILWKSSDCEESELYKKEIEFIRAARSNDPEVG